MSSSSPELNKFQDLSGKQKFPYSKHKLSIDKTDSDDRLMNIRMSGSSTSVFTTSELLNKLPIGTIIELGLPSNQSSQSSDQKLDLYSDQRQRSSSFSKLGSRETVDAIRKQQPGALKLKHEMPETYLHKPNTIEANRRKSFQLQTSQTPIEMHSVYDINSPNNQAPESDEFWLRHRSLPNIQELVEDSGSEVNPSSPTSKDSKTEIKADKLKQPMEQLKEEIKKPHKMSLDRTFDEKSKEHNAQERRSLYSKASKSSSSSNQSSSSLQRKCQRKKIPVHLSSAKSSSLKQSSTESDSSYYTAHSVHITIPEMETIGSFFRKKGESSSRQPSQAQAISIAMPDKEAYKNLKNFKNFHTSNESTSSSANLSYYSASELFKPPSSSNLNDSTQSLETEAGTIPTIVVLPNSPVTSENSVFFNQQDFNQEKADQEEAEDRKRRLLEHFHLAKEAESKKVDAKRADDRKDDKN